MATLLAQSSCERRRIERVPRNAAKRVEIARGRRGHHVVGQRGRRRVAVPASSEPFALQIVAQWLLVEAGWGGAEVVRLSSPKPRAIWRHHFVYQYNLS